MSLSNLETREDVIDIQRLSPQAAGEFRAACPKLPAVSLADNGHLTAGCLSAYRDELGACSEVAAVARQVSEALRSRDRGYAVVDFGPVVAELDFDTMISAISAFSALVATPVRVFDRWGLWKELGVSFDVAPRRATGTGHNPFHIDVVNAVRPPDFSLLYSYRPDPLGGGLSIVANMQHAADALSPETAAVLSRPVFREGSFYALSGVGDELNPFAVLSDEGHRMRRIRFTAKMIPDLPESPEKEALLTFERLLTGQQHCFLLRQHQLLLINQRITAHGRLPLEEGQEDLELGDRRLILQSFMVDELAGAES